MHFHNYVCAGTLLIKEECKVPYWENIGKDIEL